MNKMFVAVAAAMILVPTSQAITLDFQGLGDHESVNITASTGTYANVSQNTSAGELKFQDTNPGTFKGGLQFLAYCLSPGEHLQDPTTATQTTIGGAVGYLVQTYGVDRVGGVGYTAGQDAAGFQLAIWKLMDSGFVVNSASAAATTRMNFYLGVAANNSDTAVRFNAVTNQTLSQDLVTDSVPGQAVPEPFTMALAGMGLVAALRRRNRK